MMDKFGKFIVVLLTACQTDSNSLLHGHILDTLGSDILIDTSPHIDSEEVDEVTEEDTMTNEVKDTSFIERSPDLMIRKITREYPYYRTEFCNLGGDSKVTFRFRWKNLQTGTEFKLPSFYPYHIPPAGTCRTTGGLTCEVIDDPNCTTVGISILVTIDFEDVVSEADEDNNELTTTF